MKLSFIIFFTLISKIVAGQTVVYELFDEVRREGIEKICEKYFTNWETQYFYNLEGNLITKIDFNNGEIKAEYIIEYSYSDTITTIRRENISPMQSEQSNLILRKYFLTSIGTIKRYETYISERVEDQPIAIGTNFKYSKNRLTNFDHFSKTESGYSQPYSFKFEYNDVGNLKRKIEYSYYNDIFDTISYSYLYNNENVLTDIIVESSNGSSFMTVIVWDIETCNKYHIRFSKFDDRGNWRKSYFLTKNGKALRSKRKLKYFYNK